MNEPQITLELAIEHGLAKEEFESICTKLNRTPNYRELGIFSVM